MSTPHTPRKAEIRFFDGSSVTVTAFPWREGWHACPPLSDNQPVYATPADAAMAHVRYILGRTDFVDAREVAT